MLQLLKPMDGEKTEADLKRVVMIGNAYMYLVTASLKEENGLFLYGCKDLLSHWLSVRISE